MTEIWAVLVPVLITAVTTAAVVTGSAMGYFKLKGIAFFDRKTAELKEKQLEEKTKQIAKAVAQETDTQLAAKLDPVAERQERMEARLNTFIELSTVQKQLLENQGIDIDELKSGKVTTENLLSKAVTELAKANETISILAIGYQNLNRNFIEAGIKYDGSADTILEPSKRTIAQTGENVPPEVKEQMK